MEPKHLTASELWQMENGEIPITNEGRDELLKLKESPLLTTYGGLLSNIPYSPKVPSMRDNIAAFERLLATGPSAFREYMESLVRNFIDVIPFTDKAPANTPHRSDIVGHEMIYSPSRVCRGVTPVSFVYVSKIFERAKKDPVLKGHLKLLFEKRDLLFKVIDQWRAHLVHRIEYAPFDTFAQQFEYACINLLRDSRNDEELAAINDRHLLNALLDVAAKIRAEINRDFESRVEKQSLIPIEKPKTAKQRSEDTERKARQAVTLYENQIETIVKRETGKTRPLSNKAIVHEALAKYSALAVGQNLGKDSRSLSRYLKDIGKTQTALTYGGQLVGQLRHRK